jgi:hypothetical protein
MSRLMLKSITVIFLIMVGLIFNGRVNMVKLGDWVHRTREPLDGMPPFD